MSAVTLETLRADFTEADFDVVDKVFRLYRNYKAHGSSDMQTAEYANDFFIALEDRSDAFASAVISYTIGYLGVTFDPNKVETWHRAIDRLQDYLSNCDVSPHPEGRRWMQEISMAHIASRYGLKAATLYKLSGGNIDPRVSA